MELVGESGCVGERVVELGERVVELGERVVELGERVSELDGDWRS